MAMNEVKPNLISKLAAIRCQIRNIEKKGRNEHFHYEFMRAEDVAGDIGDAMAEMNIVLSKENLKVETIPFQRGDKAGFLSVVTCDYVFADGDSGEFLRVASAGAGADSTDKGIFKALTGALKYALTQTLVMRVGHLDPEDDSDEKGDNGKLEVATEAQRKLLETQATKKYGTEQKGKAWILQRCVDLDVPDYNKIPKIRFNQLMTEAMASDKSGRTRETVVDDLDP